jgi:hypothetical protein
MYTLIHTLPGRSTGSSILEPLKVLFDAIKPGDTGDPVHEPAAGLRLAQRACAQPGLQRLLSTYTVRD